MIWTTGTHQNAKFRIFDCSREISANMYFDRLLLLKLHKISSKKRIEELCLMTLASDANFVKKNNNLLFQKWQEFAEFWLELSKFLEFPFWLVPFAQSK